MPKLITSQKMVVPTIDFNPRCNLGRQSSLLDPKQSDMNTTQTSSIPRATMLCHRLV
jgi:hypothetical protein